MLDFSIPKKYLPQLDLARLELVSQIALEAAGFSNSEAITLKITDDKSIQKLNRQYREIDEPTDVLSFENDYLDPESGIHYLGDIVISIEKAQSQAAVNGNSLMHEMEMLLVHGLLHLCGYDHLERQDYLEMSALQDEVLAHIDNPLLGSINQN